MNLLKIISLLVCTFPKLSKQSCYITTKFLNCPLYQVNNFPPLIADAEDEDFEKFLSGIGTDEPEEEDPDENEFAINDRFIADFDDKEEDMINDEDYA